jgi:hypothetical protein
MSASTERRWLLRDPANSADTSSRRPRFQRDPSPFLKLPPGRTVGPVLCVDIGPDGHVWILHSRHLGGVPADPAAREALLPEVVEFSPLGDFIGAWGPERQAAPSAIHPRWPELEETIAVDGEGCVWVFGSRLNDHAAVRYARDGAFLLRIGEYGAAGPDDSRDRLGVPTDVYLDATSREAFIADGYVNHRVVSFNVDTGAFIRSWGAYGQTPPPADESKSSFHLVHSVSRGPDGCLYVCDRMNNRVQVFDAIGRADVKFVRELEVAPGTLLYGSAAEVEFSPDGHFMYIADNSNCCIWIACMESWRVIGWFAAKPTEGSGATPDSNSPPHRIVCDRNGNLLVARVFGGFERYLYQGVS